MTARKLPSNAYEMKEGETYTPYVTESVPEFTIKAAISGILLGIIFGAANTYLGLTAGLTISTSIPVAVLTVVVFKVFRAFGQKHNILETNMSQTIGSASSSVASGVLFTIPALFIWGFITEPFKAWLQITLLAMSGGLIGILAMVPLRRYLIKKEHGRLPYPEGMACSEVLVAAEHGGKQASGVFWGIATGMFFKILSGIALIKGKLEVPLLFKAKFAIKMSPALIGVGYILGLRVATIMVSGAALSALVIIPIIYLWGSNLDAPFYPETEKLIRDMSSGELWNRYIRYIGAGAVATGGIITLIQSIPAMVSSFKVGLEQLRKRTDAVAESVRFDQDLSFKVIFIFLGIILLTLTLVPGILGYIDSVVARGLASIMIAIFAFFFVTVSSRIVGLVGVTSNPTSGMTIATLIGTSLIFLLMGWTDGPGKATALMVGTVVCIAASIAGDTSQDLKTGFILGATPRKQQIGELLGVMCSAWAVCGTIILLDQAKGMGSAELPAPQATLMKLVIDGVLEQNLPWTLVFIGAVIALIAFAVKIPPLPFAVGVYLPLATMAAVFAGGVLRHFVTRKVDPAEAERRREQGVLFASGLVGGEGLTGVVLALWVVVSASGQVLQIDLGVPYVVNQILTTLGIAGLLFIIGRYATRKTS